MNEKEAIYERKTFWKWAFFICFIFLLASLLGYCESIQNKFNNNQIYQKLHKKNNETGFYEEIKENTDITTNKDGKKLSNYMIKLPSDKYRVVVKLTPQQLARRFHCPIDEFYAQNPALDPNNSGAQNPVKPTQPIAKDEVVNVPSDNESADLSDFEKQVVDLTNKARADQGLKPLLAINKNLSKSARAKSIDMLNNNYFDHTSRTYGDPFAMMKQFGVTFKSAGENIAKDQQTPQEVVNAWLNSSGHRANIMNPNFNRIGVGYASSGTTKLWTQQFIQE
jgi:uncharacterized YkwD family protein